MIIDSHLHLSPTSKGFDFDKSKKELLKEMDKNKIDYAVLIPDNLHDSSIGNLDKCLDLIKDSKNLFLLGGNLEEINNSEILINNKIKKIHIIFSDTFWSNGMIQFLEEDLEDEKDS